ncbi:hypothetical protein Tco_0352292 [Tanacetum coccineum]
MPYPRFTKVIIHHFLFKHNSIPKRHDSFVNTIKYDGVLGKLKFVNKGEDEQMYGMLVPDVMMNDAIKNCDAYLLYIALSTNIVPQQVGKGKSKGLKGKKKADPPAPKEKKKKDEALQLGDSISLIEAEVEEEQRRVQNTHKRLVVKEAASDDESDETDTYKEEESLIRRRLTGILSKGAMYASDMKKATKAGMQDYRIQQHVQGSSKGVGSKLEVPDESKDDSGSSSGSSSSGDDTEVISSNDEIKDDNQEKVAHEAKDDEEMKEAEHVVKEKTHDEENAKEQEKVVHEEGDTKMKDAEHEENEEIEKEMGDEDKIEEETAYDEHAGFRHVQDEHTEEEHVADDQAGVIILKSQPEKSEAPPTSSNSYCLLLNMSQRTLLSITSGLHPFLDLDDFSQCSLELVSREPRFELSPTPFQSNKQVNDTFDHKVLRMVECAQARSNILEILNGLSLCPLFVDGNVGTHIPNYKLTRSEVTSKNLM